MTYDITVLVNTTFDEDAQPNYKKINFKVRAKDDIQARKRGERKFNRLHKNEGKFVWLIINPKKSIYRL